MVNSVAFNNLDSLMMAFDEKNILLWFWHVKREFTQEADAFSQQCTGFNSAEQVHVPFPPTPTRKREGAAVMAATCAIRTALAAFLDHEDEEGNHINGREIYKDLIMTDCNHLVRGIGEKIRRWEENGYIRANGTAVANADQFEVLHGLIQNIEELGTQVPFGMCGRRRSQEQDPWRKGPSIPPLTKLQYFDI